MMEIAFGPVVLACFRESLVFGVLFALLVPQIQMLLNRSRTVGLGQRIGLGLVAAGLFGLTHLLVVCSADGFPPRIIQSAGVALALVAALGTVVVARQRRGFAKA